MALDFSVYYTHCLTSQNTAPIIYNGVAPHTCLALIYLDIQYSINISSTQPMCTVMFSDIGKFKLTRHLDFNVTKNVKKKDTE